MNKVNVTLTSEQLDRLIDAAQTCADQTGQPGDLLDQAIAVLEQAQALDLAAADERLCRCGTRFPAADGQACAPCRRIDAEVRASRGRSAT